MGVALSPLIGEDTQTWQDQLQADDATIKARAWNADLLAAFRTARAYYAREHGARLREAYGDEWAKVIGQAFEVYAALIDAGQHDADEDEARQKSKVRRFQLPAWRAAQYLTRKAVPFLEDFDEFGRTKSTLARAWSRNGWRWVHKLQCVTGDALMSCDTLSFSDNTQQAQAAWYIDRLNDLLTQTIRAARRSRSKRVNKFEAAFVEILRAQKRDGQIPAYAAEWKPPPPPESKAERHARRAVSLYRAAPEVFCIAVLAAREAERPAVKAREIMRRACSRAVSLVKDSPESEREALQLEAHTLIDELFAGESESAPYRAPPVLEVADTKPFDETPEPTSRARASEVNCNSGGKIEGAVTLARTEVSAESSDSEVLEYAPEAEPRGVSLAEAEAAATACASVGISKMLVVVIDDTVENYKESVRFVNRGTLIRFKERLPRYLERNALSPVESLTVRFRRRTNFRYLQCDDCPPEALAALAPFSFLRFATSPGNAQAVLALSDKLTKREYEVLKYRLFNKTTSPLGKMGVNAGGNGSARWPGSINHKLKRKFADGSSPRVQLLGVTPGRFVRVSQLEAAGLLGPAPVEHRPADVRAMKGRLPRGWPDIEPFYARYDNDRSRAEIAWAMRAGAMGWSEARVAARLGQIGAKAAMRDGDGYVMTTVRKAFDRLGRASG
jgi:hypothetical protein